MKHFLTAAAVALGANWAMAEQEEPTVFENYGTFSGKVQMLSMQRDYSDLGNANSTTAALTLDYLSPELFESGLSLKLQYVHSEVLTSGGGRLDAGNSKGESIHNSAFSILNEAYLQWDMKALGLEKTMIRAGRQIVDLDFVPKYNIRQKDQAVEGVVFVSEEIENVKLTLGHIERYSSWSSRKSGANDAFDYRFKDVEDVITSAAGLGEGVIDSTGMQVFELTYTGLENTSITLWDVYANDLLNTAGADIYYTVNDQLKLNVKYAQQDALGEMDNILSRDGKEFKSRLADFNLTYKFTDATSLMAGVYKVFGSNDENSTENFLVPFVFDHAPMSTLLWYSNPYEAGTEAVYLKGATSFGKTKAVMLYIYADHDNSFTAADAQEVNLIVSHPITEDLTVTTKLGAGFKDGKNGNRSTHATDARLFVTYLF